MLVDGAYISQPQHQIYADFFVIKAVHETVNAYTMFCIACNNQLII